MKRIAAAAALLLVGYSTLTLAQESTIRILGAYPSQLSLGSGAMTSQLQGIVTAWNASSLPANAITTLQLLNNAAAVPVSYPGLPGTTAEIAGQAWQQAAIQELRRQYQADVIVLFTNTNTCGATSTAWANGNFVPGSNGLDLRYRNEAYISVVNPSCLGHIGAHEFGHLLGGGHHILGSPAAGGLYSTSRAMKVSFSNGFTWTHIGTVLMDLMDITQGPTGAIVYNQEYSRSPPTDNAGTFVVTARSAANFYEYPSGPDVLNPPINLIGYHLGCVNGVETRYDLYWSNDPATNVPISHYEVWKAQPVGDPFIYGWTVYGPFSQSYVSGTTARARVNACSGATCSALSASYFDAVPTCNF